MSKETISPERMAELSRELGDLVSSEQHPAVTNIYIDLDTLYAFEFAAIVHMITTDTEYRYVIDRLPVFEKGYSLSLNDYLPALDFTQEQINATLCDPTITHELMCAPMMTMHHRLVAKSALVMKNNALHPEAPPIKIWINSRHFELPPVLQCKVITMMYDLFGTTDVHFHHCDYSKFSQAFFSNLHLLFIHDFSEFVNTPNVQPIMFTDGVWVDRELWIMEQAEPDMIVPPPPDRDAFFRHTEAAYGVFCLLNIVPRDIMRG